MRHYHQLHLLLFGARAERGALTNLDTFISGFLTKTEAYFACHKGEIHDAKTKKKSFTGI